MTALVVGVDVGTQGARAMAITAEGEVLAAGREEWRHPHPSWCTHEQAPSMWWTGVCNVLTRIAQQLPENRRSSIEALAVTSTSGTLLLTDGEGRPMSPAIMWNDTRAVGQVDEVALELADFTDHTGLRIRASFPVAKLRWLAQHQPEVSAAAEHVMHQSDWLLWQLGVGRAVTDPTNALKSGYDFTTHAWHPSLTSGEWQDKLPDVVPAGSTVGVLSDHIADRTGLPPGLRLVNAMTDANTATLAAGIVQTGQWASTLGTGLSIKGLSNEMLRDSAGAVYSHASPLGGWLVSGTSHCGAGAIARHFGSDERRLEQLSEQAADSAPGMSLIYPLVGRGDFFPFWAPDACAFQVGNAATPADQYRATLEGIATVERLAFERLKDLGAALPAELVVLGGAARSHLWTRIRASMQRRALRTVVRPETAVGAAITALASEGGTFAKAASGVVRYGPTVEPDDALADRYDDLAARFYEEFQARGFMDRDVAGGGARG